ncbi:nitroreductase family protein, partial [Candidatus Dependentiae bacterium]|nr:nitroreductase family protein [Candidatus Dependentiae bacterium]
MAAYESLVTRSSVREFLEKPVPKEILEKIVYAGHRAATARNLQPWIFVVVTDKESRLNIKNMCPKNGPYIEFAPACICVFCEDTTYYLEDGSAATQNIMNAAHAYGI